MNITDVFTEKRKNLTSLLKLRRTFEGGQRECPKCHEMAETARLTETNWICPKCHYYFPMAPKERIALLCDENSFRELYSSVHSRDPLQFPNYGKKLAENRKRTGQQDAFVAGVGRVGHIRFAVGVLDGRFMMGSMGTAAGEKIVRLTEYAAKRKLPLVIFSASGGARMQEGLFSLMQMAKTSAAIEKFKSSGGLFISYLTNPTTGGVSASYASLGDSILAEPDALICFAGPRVIEQTIGQTLPEGFQHAEFLLEHGMIDRIVERSRMRQTIYKLLKLHQM